MIETISLVGLLPKVFEGCEQEPPVCTSEVWLKDVELLRGRRYLISAESGTGKSSLCSFIYGNRTDYNGKIFFDGRDTRGLGIDERCDFRRRSLSLLPQEMRLFPELSVMENIRLKNDLTGFRSDREIFDLLDELEIAGKADSKAAFLSIGQQQRVAIVRALCQPFDFLILDEPVSHLDARNNAAAATMVQREADRQGAAIVATSVGNHLKLTDYTLIRL
ncbi:MAG: ATP-binding cassette domain-containing protein [Muribaculaceae bacterium]|nr:ATP-binding cassette domain-containing protein [Muribaculaceae bacterium]